MYLQKISMENYRSFHKSDLEFSKITLLLGPNSGGKTSIISSLLSALQSDGFPNYLSLNGQLVETGDYREVISSHDVRKNLSIGIDFIYGNDSAPKFFSAKGVYSRDNETSMPVLQSAFVRDEEIHWSAYKFRSKYKVEWSYFPEKDHANELRKDNPELMVALEKMLISMADSLKNENPKKKNSPNLIVDSEEMPIRGSYEADLPSILGTGIAENVWAGVSISQSISAFKRFRERFSYIGSHRFAPQRTYYHMVGSDLRVGVCGQNSIEQVIAWKNAKNKKLLELAVVMKKLGLATNIAASKLAGGRFEVRINVPGSKVSSSIADVGFGVNQILPVLVAELQLPKRSTVAVSQPETHLHPKVQAELISHFVERVKGDGFRYIIETHSEYMINRLRRLIRKGDISQGDVSVYYVEPSSAGASVHRIVFERNGKISGAPKGFFDTYQVDVMNIALQR
jgi:predicted ATPase